MADGPLILNVNDDEPNRYALTRMLQRAGFTVEEARTGREALAVIERASPELVVLDVNLPDMSGFEVCRRIKAEPRTAQIAVLHVSANFVRSEDRAFGLDAGADGYLTQPVEPPELIATVRALLRVRTAERALRRSEQRFRRLFEQAFVGILYWDDAGLVVEANDALVALVGGDRTRVVGRPFVELFAARGETGGGPVRSGEPGAPDVDWDGYRTVGTMAPVERRLLRDDGATVPVMVTAARLDVDGAGEGGFAFVLDQRERQRLFQKVEAAVHAREDLLSMVSHDLRNLINAVMLGTEALRRKATDEGVRRHADVIDRAAASMARLVRDLLDAAALERGPIAVDKKPVTPAAIAADAVELLSPLAARKSVRFETAIAAGAPESVACDRERVLQVVGNLVGNAIKFSPAGGVIQLTLEPRAPSDDVPASLLVTVSDEGPGIPAADLPHVFERYWSGRRQRGSGLGLFIARGLVEAHGGRIWIESPPGQGTRVRFTLPL